MEEYHAAKSSYVNSILMSFSFYCFHSFRFLYILSVVFLLPFIEIILTGALLHRFSTILPSFLFLCALL